MMVDTISNSRDKIQIIENPVLQWVREADVVQLRYR
jgi:hypothetical protein